MTDDALTVERLDAVAERRRERRDFFKTVATAVAAGGSMALFVGGRPVSAQSAQLTDADILNFALNLEYLEANFYHYAVFGTSIPDDLKSGTGTRGEAQGGRQVAFTDQAVRLYAREIAQDEVAHVRFLRTALGAAAVAQPAIDVGSGPNSAFSAAARSAGLIQAGQSFDPYANDENFLLGAFIFEDVGVTAYKGASPLISNKTFLEAAAGILAVEAYHSAIVRTTLYAKGMTQMQSLITATERISDARDGLDGPADKDQGVAPMNVQGVQGLVSNIVPLDQNGIAFSRSPGDVLNIVYLTRMAATMGGFFPAGVNGTIRTSSNFG